MNYIVMEDRGCGGWAKPILVTKWKDKAEDTIKILRIGYASLYQIVEMEDDVIYDWSTIEKMPMTPPAPSADDEDDVPF